MIVFIGQVASEPARPRGVPGGRLPADVRARHARLRQVGRRSARRRAAAGIRGACLPHGDAGPARAGRAGLARGHAARDDGGAGAAARRACAGGAGARRDARRCARCSPRRSGRSSSPAAAAGRAAACEASSVSPSAGSCRSAARSASRTSSTTAIRTTPATSASASIRSSRRASRRPISIARHRPAPGRDDDRRLQAARAAAAEADARAHPCRCGGAGPRLHGRPAVPSMACAAPALAALDPPADAAVGRWRARHMPTTKPTRADAGRADRHGRGRADDRRVSSPEDSVFTNGAGNFSGWLHRFYRYPGLRHAGRTQLAPTSGAMGYGVPGRGRRLAARAAPHGRSHRRRRRLPDDRPGDGDGDRVRRRHGQGQADRVVVDNGTYGTIRMHQEREYPGRVSGSDLCNPISPRWRAPTAGMPASGSTRPPPSSRRCARRSLRTAGAGPPEARRRRDHEPDDARGDPRSAEARIAGARRTRRKARHDR